MPGFLPVLPEYELSDDVVAIAGDLSVETLCNAYLNGIFPWPEDDETPLMWFHPVSRGILRASDLHISRSLRSVLRKGSFTLTTDTCFERVIEECASVPRREEGGTWITPNVKSAYIAMHKEGFAHSVEVWQDGDLAGGVYGVYVGNVFSGESMFHKVSNASKVALVGLLQRLGESGVGWMDTQMMTPVVESLGGTMVTRELYTQMLRLNHSLSPIKWPLFP